ncbi:MAG: glycosyltransferase [Odoribacteraceae bacterium]|jgi:glycosyltransferase involved in cell wall biosynthesis|nr:glycosyltransferase [Odoribacteraceae bacterium]
MNIPDNLTPRWSIIIAVYNRPREIAELLDSAERLQADARDYEIIVVDDGSTDDLREQLGHRSTALPLRYIHQQHAGPGAARNRGMREARGEFLIFVDSDCILPPGWLAAIARGVDAGQLDAFGGPDTCRADFPPLLKAIDYAMTSFIGTGGTRGNRTSVGRYYPRGFNMGFSRRVRDAVGDLNDLRHGQDMDYSMRVHAAGFRVGLIPEAYIYHKRRATIPRYARQIYNWGKARVTLSRLHPGTLRAVHLLPAGLVSGLVLLAVATAIFPREPLVRGAWAIAGAGYVAVLLLVVCQTIAKHRDARVTLLALVTITLQVAAYGAGTLRALTRRKQQQHADNAAATGK